MKRPALRPSLPSVAALALTLLASALLSSGARAQSNVLLIIADDLGVDRIAAYAEHPSPGTTPTIDALAANGVMFRHAYANPVCSTSRATLMTGRYAFRNGIGRGISPINDFDLPLYELTLADMLPAPYHAGASGKWHLQSNPGSVGSYQLHPLIMGFEQYLGGLNVFPGVISDGYTNYIKNENGVEFVSNVYATTETVDDAIDMIDSFGSDPWVMWLAFHAPHAPFHAPPPSLHTFTLPPNVADDIPLHVKAMIEAMDTEIARLFASMDPAVLANTVIIFVGDNGTDKLATTAPFVPSKAKGTIFEGGINVPLIVSGPGITAGAECTALVNTTDIFGTIAELVGTGPVAPEDSVSLVPYFSDPSQASLRAYAYAEIFSKNGFGPYERMERAIRDERYKLQRYYDPFSTDFADFLYDLDTDPFENTNLLDAPLSPEADAAYTAFGAQLSLLYDPWVDMGSALAGVAGEPSLAGSGALVAGQPISITLSGAAPLADTVLVYGINVFNLPFKGGVMVPDFSVPGDLLFLGTDVFGELTIGVNWPAGVPPATRFYMQYWTLDPAGFDGFSASNALRGMTPP